MGVTELYGGAITTFIPDGFLDASMLREVPDTQEVYVNSRQEQEAEMAEDGLGTNESVIIDLLQRVDAQDDDALLVHVEDITALNGGNSFDIIKKDTAPDGTITCILAESAYKWGKKDLKEALIICLALKRLRDVETDVVISINVPLLPKELQEHDEVPPRAYACYKILHEMVKQFKIEDKSLFA